MVYLVMDKKTKQPVGVFVNVDRFSGLYDSVESCWPTPQDCQYTILVSGDIVVTAIDGVALVTEKKINVTWNDLVRTRKNNVTHIGRKDN